MRQLATIQEIAEIQPIDGADAIEKVRVNDWWCVAKKDEFKVNDPCCYFEIDSLLPLDNPAFEFLAKGTKPKSITTDDGTVHTGYRLKTVRLRGQVSQGLALPVKTFPEILKQIAEPTFATIDEFIGTDVSETLRVVKYEAPIPAQLGGKAKGNFPGFIPKTDEERIQNIGKLIEEERGTKMYVTEKLDGTSCTFYKKDGVFGVCSRNLDLLDTEGNTHWKLAKELHLEEDLPDGYAIQGEIVGEGIQQNPLKIGGHKFYAFNVYDIKRSEYIGVDDMIIFLNGLSIEMVPRVADEWELNGDVADILEIADGFSRVNPTVKREGLVFRPVVEKIVRMRGSDSRFSFKAISNDYLLKNDE